jgi:hypothetical protein
VSERSILLEILQVARLLVGSPDKTSVEDQA